MARASGSRRAGLVVATAVTAVSVILLSSCAPPSGEPEQASTGAGPEASDTSDPQGGEGSTEAAGGTLIVARTGDIDNLDPHLATAFQTYQTLELVYSTLFELDPDLDAVPALVARHAYSDDGRVLTLELRDGVRFHDGSALDSEDVKASLERILDEGTGAVTRSNLLSIDSVEAPEALTVVLRLSEADATLPAALADVNASIMSADDIAAGTVAQEPNGSGPFVFDSWEQGQAVTLTAFEDYWGEGPYVDAVEQHVVPDEQSILAGLRAGEFHLGVLSDPAVVTQVSGEDFRVERTPSISYHVLMLNNERGPLADERVRQAIACAIDRQQVIDSALFGEGEATGPFTMPAFASPPLQGLPCDGPDVETARGLLQQAGQGPFSLEVIVISGEYQTAVNEAQALEAQLAEIGVTLELEQLETNVYVDRWLAADFDAAVALNSGRPDPHHMYARYFTSGGNLNDVATYSAPELDDLFARGKAETDPAARKEIYGRISDHLVEASPWAWLYTGYEYRVLQPDVTGFVPMPNGSLKSLRGVRVGR